MDESLSKRLAALRRKHSEEQLARAQALAKEKRDATAAAAASAAGKKNKASSSSLSPSFPGLMVGGSTGKSEATIALSRALAEDSNRRKAAAKEKEFVDPRELSGGGKVGGSVGERGESGERRERADTTTTTGTGTGGSAVGSLGPSAQGKAKGGHGAQVPSPLETPQHGDVDDEQNIGDIPQLPQTQAEEVEHQLRLQQQHEEAATEEYEEEPEPLDLDPEFELDLDDMEYILDHDPNDGIPAWLNPSYSYDDDGEDDTANTNTNYPDEPHTAGNQGDDGDGDENADAENDDDDLNFTPFEDVPSLPDFPLLPSYPRREQPTSAPRTIDLEIRPAPPGRPQPPQFHSQLQDSSSNSNINDEDVITPPPPPQKVESAEDLMEQRFLALASGLRIQHGAQPSQQQSQQHPAALRDDDLRQRFKRVLEGRHVAGSSTGGVIGGSSEVWDDEGWVGGDSVDQDLSDLMESLMSSHTNNNNTTLSAKNNFPLNSNGDDDDGDADVFGGSSSSNNNTNALWGELLLDEDDIMSQWIGVGGAGKGEAMSKREVEEIEKLLNEANIFLPTPEGQLSGEEGEGGLVLSMSEFEVEREGDVGGGIGDVAEDEDGAKEESEVERLVDEVVEAVMKGEDVEVVMGAQEERALAGGSRSAEAKIVEFPEKENGDDNGASGDAEKEDEGNARGILDESAAVKPTEPTTEVAIDTNDTNSQHEAIEDTATHHHHQTDATNTTTTTTTQGNEPEHDTEPKEEGNAQNPDDDEMDGVEEVHRQDTEMQPPPRDSIDQLAEQLVRDIIASELLHRQRSQVDLTSPAPHSTQEEHNEGDGIPTYTTSTTTTAQILPPIDQEDEEEGVKRNVFGDVEESAGDIIERIRDELSLEKAAGHGEGEQEEEEVVDESIARHLNSLPAIMTTTNTMGFGTPPPAYEDVVGKGRNTATAGTATGDTTSSSATATKRDDDEDDDGDDDDGGDDPAAADLQHRLNSLSLDFPSVPTTLPSQAAQPKPKKTMTADEFRRFREEEEAEHWCCICNEDAEYRCSGCEGDLFCEECLFAGHTGPGAGEEERRHKWTRYVRPKKQALMG